MRNRVLCLVVAGVLACAARASAQSIPGCGSVSLKTDIWQGPDYMLYVNGYTQSTRNFDGCLIKLRVEAWVDGIVMSVAIAEGYGPAVTVSYGTPVPNYADRTAIGKHWAITTGWVWLGMSSETTSVVPRPQDDASEEPELSSGDPSCGGCVSPIIIDVGRNGYRLTDSRGGVLFDLDADGIPEQVSWTHQDSDEAFLAMDRNGNGRIDDGSELFGNNTPVFPGVRTLTARNGFEALGFLESPDYGISQADETIDARDQVFGRLLLWTDRNHNGVSEPDELQPLSESEIRGLGIAYSENGRRDEHGNLFRQKGTVLYENGRAPYYDVWLRTDR